MIGVLTGYLRSVWSLSAVSPNAVSAPTPSSASPQSRPLSWCVVALLTGHAALAITGVLPSFDVLTVAESLVASLFGVRLLALGDGRTEADSPRPTLPARIAPPPADADDAERA